MKELEAGVVEDAAPRGLSLTGTKAQDLTTLSRAVANIHVPGQDRSIAVASYDEIRGLTHIKRHDAVAFVVHDFEYRSRAAFAKPPAATEISVLNVTGAPRGFPLIGAPLCSTSTSPGRCVVRAKRIT